MGLGQNQPGACGYPGHGPERRGFSEHGCPGASQAGWGAAGTTPAAFPPTALKSVPDVSSVMPSTSLTQTHPAPQFSATVTSFQSFLWPRHRLRAPPGQVFKDGVAIGTWGDCAQRVGSQEGSSPCPGPLRTGLGSRERSLHGRVDRAGAVGAGRRRRGSRVMSQATVQRGNGQKRTAWAPFYKTCPVWSTAPLGEDSGKGWANCGHPGEEGAHL